MSIRPSTSGWEENSVTSVLVPRQAESGSLGHCSKMLDIGLQFHFTMATQLIKPTLCCLLLWSEVPGHQTGLQGRASQAL